MNSQASTIIIVVSVVCAYLAQAAFTPAIMFSVVFFLIGIMNLFKGYFKTAIALILINALAFYGVWEMTYQATVIEHHS